MIKMKVVSHLIQIILNFPSYKIKMPAIAIPAMVAIFILLSAIIIPLIINMLKDV